MASKKENLKTLVLLDAHAILHRAYHALPDFSSSKGEPTGALYGLSTMLIKIIKDLKPDYLAACYDLAAPTFRHEAYDAYKKGRAKTDDALVRQIIRSRDVFAAFHIPAYEAVSFEADDLLGTIVEQLKKEKKVRIVIASGDMDTLQLVDDDRVVVYTLKKGLNDTILYNEQAVVDRFEFLPKYLPDYKGLRGDPSDNIIGIPGIGEKTATLLVKEFKTIEEMYKTLKKSTERFENIGIKPRVVELLREHEEDALFSKTLATIRRDAPIEFTFPETPWHEHFTPALLETLFAELEFRSMGARARDLVSGPSGGAKNAPIESDTEKDPREGEVVLEIPADDEIKKVQIALWLVNSDFTNVSLEDLHAFTKTRTLAQATEALVGELKQKGLVRVYEEIELPIISIIRDAEVRGIKVDAGHLKALSLDYHKTLSAIEKEIWKLAGEEFNINSPKQLGEVLFDRMHISTKGLKKTAGGARSTRESELLKLKDGNPIIERILAYRELQKLLSTYIDTIPEMLDRHGRLHTTLNQTGTTTGRMSSNNPNLQNIPASEGMGVEIRKAFVAEEGSVLAAFDYSQIEIRVLAVLAEDPELIRVFREGKDVHAAVAAHVFGVSEREVTKDMRRKAKVINFGIIYGMGINALRANLGGTREEAQTFYDAYFKNFPAIGAYFDRVIADARKKGYTETYFGRRRSFEGIRSSVPYIRAAAERMAMNAPIQGTAADIIKIAMREAHEELKKNGLVPHAPLLLQVHDELIYEIEKKYTEKAVPIIKHAMECAVDFPIPLVVNVSTGPSWGEFKGETK
ncbi:MAG: DNA polymerase [Minisyncoccota bacterium]